MKKYIGVHVQEDYPNSYGPKWIEYINRTDDFEAVPIDLKAVDVIDGVRNMSGIMWHYRHTPKDKQVASMVLMAIEQGLNIPVWPNINTRWAFDNKAAEHFALSTVSDDWKVPSWVFWNKDKALDFVEHAKYPIVFKLSVGAGSASVVLINDVDEALLYVNKMFDKGIYPYSQNEYKETSMEGDRNYPGLCVRLCEAADFVINKNSVSSPWYYELQKNYIYFQKFIQNNVYDIRITVIGDRAFGFIRWNRDDDFRASGSGKIDYDTTKIPIEAVRRAFKVSEINGYQSMAYDFLIDETGAPLINEMSYCYNHVAVYNCPGYWNSDMVWHEGHVWPEEAHVADFVQSIRKRDDCDGHI